MSSSNVTPINEAAAKVAAESGVKKSSSALAQVAVPHTLSNRELSWLAFNTRVLEEATNKSHPLLERVRFLSISANNLDEFYMVRVAGLRAQINQGVKRRSDDGLTASDQLEKINARTSDLMESQHACWTELVDKLARNRILIPGADDLTAEDLAFAEDWFLSEVFPIVTPLAIDPAHPFPFIPNLGFSLALELKNLQDGRPMNALLPIPRQVRRFIRLPDGNADGGEATQRFYNTRNLDWPFSHTDFPGL